VSYLSKGSGTVSKSSEPAREGLQERAIIEAAF